LRILLILYELLCDFNLDYSIAIHFPGEFKF